MTRFVVRGDKPQEPERPTQFWLEDKPTGIELRAGPLGRAASYLIAKLRPGRKVVFYAGIPPTLGLPVDGSGYVQAWPDRDGCLTPEQQAAIDGLVAAVGDDLAQQYSPRLTDALNAYHAAFDAKDDGA